MKGPTLVVHRGTSEIGGNCVELVASSGERLILDVGRPLDASEEAVGLLPSSLGRDAPATVLISHSHQDHWGLLEEVPESWRVHCGEATESLIRLTADFSRRPLHRNFVTWRSGVPFEVGPFRIMPELTDHSAFDAYMLTIEVEGRKVVYSGDFRLHGRKAALVRRAIAVPPANVDVLVLEGTNLGSDKPTVGEDQLENEFVSLMRDTPGRVFVAWSAQNIDRTVTLYRASKRTGRKLAVDLYTADVLETLASFGRIPQPGWDNLKVVITRSFARLYRMRGREDFVTRMAKHGIAASALAGQKLRWTVMTRKSLLRDFEAAAILPDAGDAWSWSMWSGYLTNRDGSFVREWFERQGARAHHLHTSGHASPDALREFAAAVNPTVMVPIHSLAWDDVHRGFPPMLRLRDGECVDLRHV